jgi:preprotein translocase subunit SecG
VFTSNVSFWSHALNLIIILLGLLLILTILIQRGKGGGLIGAFGGAGGSSPFGSKAGDTFTRITITMAGIWVLLIMIHVKVAKANLPGPDKNPPAETSGQG